MEILRASVQRFCVKLNLLFPVSLPEPAPPWAALSQGTSKGWRACISHSVPGGQRAAWRSAGRWTAQAGPFLEELDNTMRKALNGERRLWRSAGAEGELGDAAPNPAPRMDGTGGPSAPLGGASAKVPAVAGGVCQGPAPCIMGVFVFAKHFGFSCWGFQGMRISSPGKGINPSPLPCQKAGRPQRSEALFCSSEICLWSKPMEQKLIILPLNRGISAETLKRQGEGKWEAARTPLRASGGAQPERKPGEEQGRTEAPYCRPRGTPRPFSNL